MLRERIDRLPKEDRNDLYELLPALLGGNEEEQTSAARAVREIMDQHPVNRSIVELPEEPGDEMNSWIDFVSTRIRQAREKAGMTQDELSLAADLPQSHISRLENGKHSPTSMTLEKIANALGVSVSIFDPCAPDS